MAIEDKEKRNAYIKEWKRLKRLQEGKFPRGKTPKPQRSTEQIEQSQQNRKEYERVYNEANPYHSIEIRQRMLYNAKRRAQKKQLPFSLVIEDIVIPEVCPYLNIPLKEHAYRDSYRGTFSGPAMRITVCTAI